MSEQFCLPSKAVALTSYLLVKVRLTLISFFSIKLLLFSKPVQHKILRTESWLILLRVSAFQKTVTVTQTGIVIVDFRHCGREGYRGARKLPRFPHISLLSYLCVVLTQPSPLTVWRLGFNSWKTLLMHTRLLCPYVPICVTSRSRIFLPSLPSSFPYFLIPLPFFLLLSLFSPFGSLSSSSPLSFSFYLCEKVTWLLQNSD